MNSSQRFRTPYLLALGVAVFTVNIAASLPARSSVPNSVSSPEWVSQIPGAPGSTPVEASYTLGAGDRINIEVFQLPQYSGEREVLVDGSINLPVVGSLSVEGLTIKEAERAIAAQYSQTLRRPIVTVNLLQPRSIQIGIAGEVNRPGAYTISPNGSQLPTVTQLIESAGGIRMTADLRQVQIRRQTPSGAEQVNIVDLWQLLQTGSLSYDPVLRDGDTIFIPAVETFNAAEATQLADASFAADETQPLNIAVVGEVFRPGPYTVTGTARTGAAGEPGGAGGSSTPPTVTRAIQVAGGIQPLASVRNIQVYRRVRSGNEQTITVDLWKLLQEGDLTQDIVLQEGDTVFVPTATEITSAESTQLASASFSPDTMRVNIVGEVVQPGVVQVPPNTPLNQALLAAGGFNNRASQGSVDLVRLNSNGTVERRSIPVDFSEGVDESINPTLRNNDVLIVRRSAAAGFSDTLGTVISPLEGVLNLLSIPFRFLGIFD